MSVRGESSRRQTHELDYRLGFLSHDCVQELCAEVDTVPSVDCSRYASGQESYTEEPEGMIFCVWFFCGPHASCVSTSFLSMRTRMFAADAAALRLTSQLCFTRAYFLQILRVIAWAIIAIMTL